MPNPAYLRLKGLTIWQYNSLSPKKKEAFQKEARQELIELHENDIDAYKALQQSLIDNPVETEMEAD